MRPTILLTALTLLAPAILHAQWQLQNSHTAADLRGIDSLGNGVAWASGANGTVLRTEDAGTTWTRCATPPSAEKLDFRGVQALGKDSAIVMSSGTGDASRLYKTTDACRTWKQVFADPDAKGFFDSLHRVTPKQLFLLGDPVDGKFALFTSRDAGDTWFIADDPGLEAPAGAGAFAASNTSLASLGSLLFFATGGPSAAIYRVEPSCDTKTGICGMAWHTAPTPLAHGRAEDGVYSVAARLSTGLSGRSTSILVAVGGAYDRPTDPSGSAAASTDGGRTWTAAAQLPGGYRSAVAYDPKTNTWITVGPDGTDLSSDDGRSWRPLKAAAGDPPDADIHWNALALPFAVGPGGRIGTLRPESLKP